MNVTTMAGFKRFLAEPGATLRVVRNDWMDTVIVGNTGRTRLTPKPGYWEPKRVQKLQSNTVQFTTGSWLQFPKAAHVRFGGDTMTICMQENGTFTEVLVYQLTKD